MKYRVTRDKITVWGRTIFLRLEDQERLKIWHWKDKWHLMIFVRCDGHNCTILSLPPAMHEAIGDSMPVEMIIDYLAENVVSNVLANFLQALQPQECP